MKHKLRHTPELPKRVLTSAAKVAKHRRAMDKRRRETPCWWIANGNPPAKATSARSSTRCHRFKDKLRARLVCHRPVWPQIVMETRRKYFYFVELHSLFLDRQRRLNFRGLLRSPFRVRQPRLNPRDLLQNLFHTCLHRWNSRDLLYLHFVHLRSRSSRRILDVTIGSRFGDECSSSDSLFDGWSDDSPRDSGTGAQHEFYTDMGWRSDHWKRDSWHSSHWRTTEDHRKHVSWHSSHWRTSDWPRKDGSFPGCDGTWNKQFGCDSWNSSHWKTIGWVKKERASPRSH